MKNCKAFLTLVAIVMAVTSSLIFVTSLTADSFAQGNTTSTGNQSESANTTGYVNQAAVGEESSGQISQRK